MICPNCHAEFRPGFTVCSDCGIALVDDLGIVSDQLSELVERSYPKAEQAADFFDDLVDEEGL